MAWLVFIKYDVTKVSNLSGQIYVSSFIISFTFASEEKRASVKSLHKVEMHGYFIVTSLSANNVIMKAICHLL
jgi:hypothetical protein